MYETTVNKHVFLSSHKKQAQKRITQFLVASHPDLDPTKQFRIRNTEHDRTIVMSTR
jgi:hypothetical protein